MFSSFQCPHCRERRERMRMSSRYFSPKLKLSKAVTLSAFVQTPTAPGLLMVASTSIVISEHLYSQPFHYFFRQIIYLVLGVILGVFVFRVRSEIWQEFSMSMLLISLFLLMIVLVPGIGREVVDQDQPDKRDRQGPPGQIRQTGGQSNWDIRSCPGNMAGQVQRRAGRVQVGFGENF